MSKINDKGYELVPEETIIEDVRTIFSNSFVGLNVNNESPMGNVILGFSSDLDNFQKDAFNVFNSLDLDSCEGQDLDNAGKLIGLSRRALEPSILTVQATSTATGYTIVEGSLFYLTENSDSQFKSISDYLMSSTVQDISLESLEYIAEDEIAVGDKLSSLTNYPDLSDLEITNIVNGEEAESDYDYRIRLKNVRVSDGVTGTERMEKVLQETTGVLDSVVFDINTDNTIPLGYIESVVLGGTDADIASAIWNSLDMGTATQGTSTENIVDNKGITVPINFSRPDDLTATFALEVSLTGGALTQDMREEIVESFESLCEATFIGGTLYYQDFYASVVDVITGVARIETLTINTTTDDVVATSRERIIPDNVDPNTSIIIIT